MTSSLDLIICSCLRHRIYTMFQRNVNYVIQHNGFQTTGTNNTFPLRWYQRRNNQVLLRFYSLYQAISWLTQVIHFFFRLLRFGSKYQWPRGLGRRSAAARLLRLWVRIPPGHGCLTVVRVVCCLWRADHSSRGVLSSAMRRCVWSRQLMIEGAMSRVGRQRQKK